MAGKMRPLFPDFWTDDRIVALSPLARLAFMGLWSFACDNGHVEDRSKQLKRRILPDDAVNMADLLDEIAHIHEHLDDDPTPLITRVDGWVVVHGSDRWVVDNRWLKRCDYPGCVYLERKTRGGTKGAPRGPRGSHRAEERNEGEMKAAAAAPLDPALDVLRAKLQAHTRLQALRFDTLGPQQADLLVALIHKHGDDRLVQVALDTCKATPPVHVSAFLGTWDALPDPGQRLRAVEQKFCGTHDWIRLTPAGTCTSCASERLEKGANA